jgi:hypothetical protein
MAAVECRVRILAMVLVYTVTMATVLFVLNDFSIEEIYTGFSSAPNFLVTDSSSLSGLPIHSEDQHEFVDTRHREILAEISRTYGKRLCLSKKK